MAQASPKREAVLTVLQDEIDDFEKEAGRFLRGEWDPNAFMAFRLRLGVYGQRQPDVHMLRVKIPVGGVTAEQIEALGVIARDFAPQKKGHVTTREDMQFHFVPLDRVADALRIVGEAGLSSREAAGNAVRNVTGCPFAGVCAHEPFDVTPYARAFARYFLRNPLTQALPRKFKASFSGCEMDCAITSINDMGFLPRVQELNGESKRGFKVVVGGGLAIMPRIALTLYEFVPVEEYLRVSVAVLRVFDASDELRKDKMKARMKFLVDRIGIDAFRKLVEAELEKPWARNSIDPTPLLYIDDEEASAPPPLAPGSYPLPGEDRAEFELWRAANVKPQKQTGYHAVLVKLPQGDILEHQFPLLADIARRYAGDRARLTQHQGLVFRWVREEALYQVWQELKAGELAEPESSTITDVTSCPGTDSCKLGITSSMGLAREIGRTLKETDISDPLTRGLHIRISGCPNSCGQHHIANIGFHGASMKGDRGNQVPAYEMFLGGSYQDLNGHTEARIGLRPRGKIPAKRTPEAVRRILGYYRQHRLEAEPFNAFVDRVGMRPFESIIQEFKDVGPLNRENIGTYMDWDKTVLYKLERGEGECAV